MSYNNVKGIFAPSPDLKLNDKFYINLIQFYFESNDYSLFISTLTAIIS